VKVPPPDSDDDDEVEIIQAFCGRPTRSGRIPRSAVRPVEETIVTSEPVKTSASRSSVGTRTNAVTELLLTDFTGVNESATQRQPQSYGNDNSGTFVERRGAIASHALTQNEPICHSRGPDTAPSCTPQLGLASLPAGYFASYKSNMQQAQSRTTGQSQNEPICHTVGPGHGTTVSSIAPHLSSLSPGYFAATVNSSTMQRARTTGQTQNEPICHTVGPGPGTMSSITPPLDLDNLPPGYFVVIEVPSSTSTSQVAGTQQHSLYHIFAIDQNVPTTTQPTNTLIGRHPGILTNGGTGNRFPVRPVSRLHLPPATMTNRLPGTSGPPACRPTRTLANGGIVNRSVVAGAAGNVGKGPVTTVGRPVNITDAVTVTPVVCSQSVPAGATRNGCSRQATSTSAVVGRPTDSAASAWRNADAVDRCPAGTTRFGVSGQVSDNSAVVGRPVDIITNAASTTTGSYAGAVNQSPEVCSQSIPAATTENDGGGQVTNNSAVLGRPVDTTDATTERQTDRNISSSSSSSSTVDDFTEICQNLAGLTDCQLSAIKQEDGTVVIQTTPITNQLPRPHPPPVPLTNQLPWSYPLPAAVTNQRPRSYPPTARPMQPVPPQHHLKLVPRCPSSQLTLVQPYAQMMPLSGEIVLNPDTAGLSDMAGQDDDDAQYVDIVVEDCDGFEQEEYVA